MSRRLIASVSVLGMAVLGAALPVTVGDTARASLPAHTPSDLDHSDGKAADGWRPAPAGTGKISAGTACTDGMAGPYPCKNVDLLSHLPLNTIGGGSGNDIWGWTDPQSGNEYALVGRSSGTSFVDISDPENPVYLGNLPTATRNSSWRDVKVHANHAYIVSEASGHGLQTFDLTRLRNVSDPPVQFTADDRDTSFGNAHNIAVNEDTGFAYVLGSGTCSGGPRIFDLSNPADPSFAGCMAEDGYTHDSQAVAYHGPDSRYQGAEIVFNSNEDTLTVVDATDKANPAQLSRTGYPDSSYAHQGWLTEDHEYFLLNDESGPTTPGTRTYVFDVSDLHNPQLLGYYAGETTATAHNAYNTGGYSYQSNYQAGLRIIDLANVSDPGNMTEAAYFDVYPSSDSSGFNGTWSNYPFFDSGVVIISSTDGGLFVVRPDLTTPPR